MGKYGFFIASVHYSERINTFVTENQYKKEDFEIQLFPPKDKFIVKRGEIIALSGNTGSSAGAHLHFEIRNTKTEHPMNPLKFFDIADNIKPTISQIKIYSIDGSIDGEFKDPVRLSLKGIPICAKPTSCSSTKALISSWITFFAIGLE